MNKPKYDKNDIVDVFAQFYDFYDTLSESEIEEERKNLELDLNYVFENAMIRRYERQMAQRNVKAD